MRILNWILLYTTQSVAFEVPEGDIVDFDIYVTSFHRFVLKNSEQNIYNM